MALTPQERTQFDAARGKMIAARQRTANDQLTARKLWREWTSLVRKANDLRAQIETTNDPTPSLIAEYVEAHEAAAAKRAEMEALTATSSTAEKADLAAALLGLKEITQRVESPKDE